MQGRLGSGEFKAWKEAVKAEGADGAFNDALDFRVIVNSTFNGCILFCSHVCGSPGLAAFALSVEHNALE